MTSSRRWRHDRLWSTLFVHVVAATPFATALGGEAGRTDEVRHRTQGTVVKAAVRQAVRYRVDLVTHGRMDGFGRRTATSSGRLGGE